MVKFEFCLSDNDTDRLFAIKNDLGKETMTGDELAEYLITEELHELHPGIPEFDENGKLH